jgi:hypothetical protein
MPEISKKISPEVGPDQLPVPETEGSGIGHVETPIKTPLEVSGDVKVPESMIPTAPNKISGKETFRPLTKEQEVISLDMKALNKALAQAQDASPAQNEDLLAKMMDQHDTDN